MTASSQKKRKARPSSSLCQEVAGRADGDGDTAWRRQRAKRGGRPRRRGTWRRRWLMLAAGLLALFLAWLLSFPGRVFLFLLALIRPAAMPSPLALLSLPPRVERVEFPSESGRRIVAHLYSPGGRRSSQIPRHPGILLYTPVSRNGLANPGVKRAADSFARLGYLVMVPFPGGQAIPYASVNDIADARAALRQFLQLPQLDASRSIGAGLSYGSGPLLLAVADLPPSMRPSRLMSLGGYADLRELLRFATTGSFAYGALRGRRTPDPYLRQVAGRTLAAWAAPPDRPLLRALVEQEQKTVPTSLSPEGRQMARLFLNRQPKQFDTLYHELPASIRSRIEALSLPERLGGLEAKVYVLHPADDEFVPPSEALRLWEKLPGETRGMLLLPPVVSHGLPLRGWEEPIAFVKSLSQVYRFSYHGLYPTPIPL